MVVLQRTTRRLLREAQLQQQGLLIPHARLFSAPAVSAYNVSQQSTARTSSSALQSDQTNDWSSHRNVQFSIRPSLLSPLYSTFRQEQDVQTSRTLTSHLISAHQILKEEHDGFDQEQVVRTARHRAAALRQLAQDLRSMAPRGNLPACTDRKLMLGFYSILEEQVVGAQPAQLPSASSDSSSPSASVIHEVHDEADVYQRMATGRISVEETWTKYFHNKYAGMPSLEPLEKIYAKKDILRAVETLDEPLANGKIGDGPGGKVRARKHGVCMDVEGTVTAEGKRKTSFAKLTLRRTMEQSITINGTPYDEYFRDLAVRAHAVQPLVVATNTMGLFEINVEVTGGGFSSQAQAVRTALARALMLYSNDVGVRSHKAVRSLGRWDGRQVERKKPGRKKARKGFTWVKR